MRLARRGPPAAIFVLLVAGAMIFVAAPPGSATDLPPTTVVTSVDTDVADFDLNATTANLDSASVDVATTNATDLTPVVAWLHSLPTLVQLTSPAAVYNTYNQVTTDSLNTASYFINAVLTSLSCAPFADDSAAAAMAVVPGLVASSNFATLSTSWTTTDSTATSLVASSSNHSSTWAPFADTVATGNSGVVLVA